MSKRVQETEAQISVVTNGFAVTLGEMRPGMTDPDLYVFNDWDAMCDFLAERMEDPRE